MARVTIEDCRKHIPNRFELVILAAQRAKDLSLGMPSLVQKTRDKDPVLALREIAASRIDCQKLRSLVLSKYADPLRKMSGNNKSNSDLEDIFKDLAAAVSPDIVEPQDEYEEEVMPLDEHSYNKFHETEEGYEEDEEDDGHKAMRQQHLDIDVSFVDEEVDD